jgi:TetR/AcrR family transcriptional regulator, cholesterol catabolism regulator
LSRAVAATKRTPRARTPASQSLAKEPRATASKNVGVEPAVIRKAGKTRQRILDAAAGVFAERGFGATSLNDISAAASMKSGSLYFHFESKDALIGEVVREGLSRSLQLVRGAVDALGPKATARERIAAAIGAHLGALRSLASYAAAVLKIVEHVPADVRASFRPADRRYLGYWNELIAQAQRDGLLEPGADPRVVRRILFGAMNSIVSTSPNAQTDAEMQRVLLRLLRL